MARLDTPLKKPLIRFFIRHSQVDVSEAEEPDVEAYADFDAFFTRRLKAGVREICTQPLSLAAPCDGTMMQVGDFEAGQLVQAKGRTYQTADLLGRCAGANFESGKFCTIYLSPADCHRVYMPLNGTLEEMIHVLGRLFSVAPYATRSIPRLYARNERVVCIFDTAIGKVAVVMVGAIGVAAIETSWHGLVAPRSHAPALFRYREAEAGGKVTLQRGEEMGCFHLGSSVIVLTESRDLVWNPLYPAGARVKIGCEMGCVPEA